MKFKLFLILSIVCHAQTPPKTAVLNRFVTVEYGGSSGLSVPVNYRYVSKNGYVFKIGPAMNDLFKNSKLLLTANLSWGKSF